ncbi:MAG: hypothetical protein IJ419_13680 [Agathobacter sp.]|nr:hypothetical protein [Agathobacter sp.]
MEILNAILTEQQAADIFAAYKADFIQNRRHRALNLFAPKANVLFSDKFLLEDEKCPLVYKFWLLSQKGTIRDVQIVGPWDNKCDIWVYLEKDKFIHAVRINNLKHIMRTGDEKSYIDLASGVVVTAYQPEQQVLIQNDIRTAEEFSDVKAIYETRFNALWKREKRKATMAYASFCVCFAAFVACAIWFATSTGLVDGFMSSPAFICLLISMVLCVSTMPLHGDLRTKDELREATIPLKLQLRKSIDEQQVLGTSITRDDGMCTVNVYGTSGGNVVQATTMVNIPYLYKTDINKPIIDMDAEKVYWPYTGV